MFTGIIEKIGTVVEFSKETGKLLVESMYQDLVLGESIAIDGVCLTVCQLHKTSFLCELSIETLNKTNFCFKKIGEKVNLERALKVGDRLGGHWVTGHVDEPAKVLTFEDLGEFKKLKISYTQPHYLVKKGSIAVNGVSLTLNEIEPDGFCVMLIPHTLENTNLQGLQIGSCVNLEYDYIAKVIEVQNEYRNRKSD